MKKITFNGREFEYDYHQGTVLKVQHMAGIRDPQKANEMLQDTEQAALLDQMTYFCMLLTCNPSLENEMDYQKFFKEYVYCDPEAVQKIAEMDTYIQECWDSLLPEEAKKKLNQTVKEMQKQR